MKSHQLLAFVALLAGCTTSVAEHGQSRRESDTAPRTARSVAGASGRTAGRAALEAGVDANSELSSPPAETVAAVRKLQGAFGSPEDLFRAVLRGIEAKDAEAMRAVLVTEEEYKTYLWPEFPQAKDPRHTLPVDFHWGLLKSRSHGGIREAMDRYGGNAFELLDFSHEIAEYDSYRLLRKISLKVRRGSDGKEGALDVLGSVVVLDGQYKLLSYPS